MTTAEIPTDLFTTFFRPSIRVLLDWDRLVREKWSIRAAAITDDALLGGWYLPWYMNQRGQEVTYADPQSRPLQVGEVASRLHGLEAGRQELIAALARGYQSARPPIQLVAPVYALGSNRFLLLDGSHRIAALQFAEVGFTLLAFTIYGPVDAQALPDLQHWISATSGVGVGVSP